MDDDMKISLRLKSICDKVRKTGDASFEKYGLTGRQVGYLAMIQRAGGSMSQKELEKQVGVSHPTIVGVVSRLEHRGFVKVTTDRKDRRNRIITMTPEAVRVKDELHNGWLELNAQLTKNLKPSDLDELNRLLEIMDSNLDELINGKEDNSNEA